MSRTEFSVKTKQAAWKRAGGKCECGCGRSFGKHPKERPEYDHIVEDYLGGDNSLENCRVIRGDCHTSKNKDRAPALAKARRGEKQRQGIKAKKALIPGSKGTGMRRKMDGTVVFTKDRR